MPAISSTTLANGVRVDLSTGPFNNNGPTDLIAQLFDSKGALLRTITVDTATNSNGTTSPPRGEGFSNFKVVGLANGGFAVAYDDTVDRGSNVSEIHTYDAAGAALGANVVTTSSGGQPAPFPGTPEIFATADNRLLALERLPDGLQHLRLIGLDGALLADTTYEARPTNVYDAGFTNQVVVTLPDQTREILGHDLKLISSGAITTQTGTAGADVLAGGSGADDLIGAAGNDTLIGGAGFDVLTGGAGSDKFVFAVDGSVDQAADFDSATDTLALVDASGAPISSATGILTFYKATGVLTYDADGDNGPGAAVTVGVLKGATSLTQANFAPGYEPAQVRIYNAQNPAQAGLPQGSHSDLTFGFGHKDFVLGQADYNAAGTLLTYVTVLPDGTSATRWFDQTNAQTWDNLVADFDNKGGLLIYATYFDDKTHVLWRFDPDNSHSDYTRIIDQYDGQGRLLSHEVVADDGSHWGATFDVANTKPYGYAVDFFDAQGNLLRHSLFNDDGTPFQA